MLFNGHMRVRAAVRGLLIFIVPSLVGPGLAAAQDEIFAARRSKVYHIRLCSAARNISAENRVRFKSEKEAAAEGRRLCKSCARMVEREADAAERAKTGAADTPAADAVENRRERKDNLAKENEGAPESGGAPLPSAGDAADPAQPDNREADEPELETLSTRVRDVVAGGTLVLEGGERVCLWGIGCPRSGQMDCEAVSSFLEKRVKGRKVQVQWHFREAGSSPRDALGRLVASVAYGSDKSDLASALLLEGLAWVDRGQPCPRRAEYLNKEDDAAWSQRGVWKRLPGAAGRREAVVGKHTHQYHAPDCPHAMHLIEPSTITLNEARGRRLSPCEFWRDAK